MSALRIASWAVVTMLLMTACAPSRVGPMRPQSMLACDHRALEHNGRAAGPAIAAAAYGSVSDVPLNAVTVLDRAVFDAAIVQSLYSERIGAGVVRVTARFANCTGQRLQLRARTSFLRADQSPSEAASAWQDVFVEPHGLATYEESSLATTAVSYVIELDRAR